MKLTAQEPRYVFLFGAGISIEAGLPSMERIESVIDNEPNLRAYPGNLGWFIDPANEILLGPPVRIARWMYQKLKGHISDEKQQYGAQSPSVSYEEVAQLARSVHDRLLGEYEIFGLGPFIEQLKLDYETFMKTGKGLNIEGGRDFNKALDLCYKMIRGVVVYLISTHSYQQYLKYPYLTFLKEIPKEVACDSFTLNHDYLLEETLGGFSIPFEDGLLEPDVSGNHKLDITQYGNTNKNLRVFKLHGSWDWNRHNFQDNEEASMLSWHGEGIYRISNPHIENGDGGYTLAQRPEGPWILVGTWLKGLRYNHGPFPWLIQHFRASLASTPTLVVAGTSLNDQAINGIILDWLFASTRNRMLVIHPNQDEFKNNVRGEWRLKMDDLVEKGYVRFLERRIGKDRVTLDEINHALA